jgi:hypothetical protein
MGAWLDLAGFVGLALVFAGGVVRKILREAVARPLLAKLGELAEATGVALGLKGFVLRAVAGAFWAKGLLLAAGLFVAFRFVQFAVELLSTSPWHRSNGGIRA